MCPSKHAYLCDSARRCFKSAITLSDHDEVSQLHYSALNTLQTIARLLAPGRNGRHERLSTEAPPLDMRSLGRVTPLAGLVG